MAINKRCAGALVILVLLSGCMGVKKAERVMRANPVELARLCADCFTVKPIEVIKGDTIVRVDSITRVDSVRVEVEADCPDGTRVKVDCPPTKTVERIKYTHTSDTVKIRDTAMEIVLENSIKESNRKAKDLQKKFYYALGACFVLLAVLILKR